MTQTIDSKKFFQNLRQDRDVPLHESMKELIQEMIDVLQDEYNKIILNPSCSEYDALEYILLFAIEGAIAASRLGSNMDEYFVAVDIYAGLLGLYGDDVREEYLKNTQDSETLEQDYEKMKKKPEKGVIDKLKKEFAKGESDETI